MPVTAPDLKAIVEAAGKLCAEACAVRTLARTDTCMPMIAGSTRQDGADQKADGGLSAEQEP
jgi:hypothetical protein